MIALMSAMTVLLYVVSSNLRCNIILTDKLIPDPDSIPDIFISKDDSIDECNGGYSICGKC